MNQELGITVMSTVKYRHRLTNDVIADLIRNPTRKGMLTFVSMTALRYFTVDMTVGLWFNEQ